MILESKTISLKELAIVFDKTGTVPPDAKPPKLLRCPNCRLSGYSLWRYDGKSFFKCSKCGFEER